MQYNYYIEEGSIKSIVRVFIDYIIIIWKTKSHPVLDQLDTCMYFKYQILYWHFVLIPQVYIYIFKQGLLWQDPPLPIVWMVQKIFPEDFNPHCDLGHEDSNQKLPQNTAAVDDATLYHVWLQKVQKFRYRDMEQTVIFWGFQPALWPWPWG